ncbi:MAG: hypothetical protein LC113_13050 [Acidobacteria bacterium]|nr:hypothetical protein [Acidobacteriota bacterium]
MGSSTSELRTLAQGFTGLDGPRQRYAMTERDDVDSVGTIKCYTKG